MFSFLQGEPGVPGQSGAPGKEGLIGPKVQDLLSGHDRESRWGKEGYNKVIRV